MTKNDFTHMLHRLAVGWTRADYDAVLAEFDPAVKYADPTRYSFAGLPALRSFFEGGEPVEQHCVFHTIVFDEEKQLGAAEYTYRGHHQYHGTVWVRVHNGKITHWREYQHVDGRSWAEFTEGTC